MVEAVSGLLTPLHQLLSFLEDTQRRPRRARGRRSEETSSESTSEYSGGKGPSRRGRRLPRPVARAVHAEPVGTRVSLRDIPEKIIPTDERYAAILECETYALHNKDNNIRGVQGSGLAKKKKDMASLFGHSSEFGGDPPFGVFELLYRFQKAADDHDV